MIMWASVSIKPGSKMKLLHKQDSWFILAFQFNKKMSFHSPLNVFISDLSEGFQDSERIDIEWRLTLASLITYLVQDFQDNFQKMMIVKD